MSNGWRNRKDYSTYRKTRTYLMQENLLNNNGDCTLQIPGTCTGKAEQIHHVNGVENGHDPRNLMPVCMRCNNHIGSPTKGKDPSMNAVDWL